MDEDAVDDERGLRRGFSQVSPLSKAERITLLVLTAGLLIAGIVMHVVAGDPLLAVVYESSLTVALVGFAFAPRLSALVYLVLLFGAFFSVAQALALVVAAVAFALVVRTCGLGIVLLFAVLWSSGLVWSSIENGTPIGETVVLIVVGVVSASSGLILRRIEAGSRRLKEQLEARARAEHDSIVSERYGALSLLLMTAMVLAFSIAGFFALRPLLGPEVAAFAVCAGVLTTFAFGILLTRRTRAKRDAQAGTRIPISTKWGQT